MAKAIKRIRGTGTLDDKGYVWMYKKGNKKIQEHTLLVERALGKSLPAEAEIHHLDGNPSNNNPTNLVICPNRAYHMLLHQRMRALEMCGKADYIKCCFCKQYDAPENIKRAKRNNFHRNCYNMYHQNWMEKKRGRSS